MNVATYQSKPASVQAVQVTIENLDEVAEWCGGRVAGARILIDTNNGQAEAPVGHWVVKGISDFYPCDATTFAARWLKSDDPPSRPATDAERAVLRAMVRYIDEKGYAPSYREIGELAGLRSISTVSTHLHSLRKKGYVDWTNGKKRTIRIIHG